MILWFGFRLIDLLLQPRQVQTPRMEPCEMSGQEADIDILSLDEGALAAKQVCKIRKDIIQKRNAE